MEFKGFTDQQLEELIKDQKILDDKIRKNNGISETVYSIKNRVVRISKSNRKF